MSDGSNAESMDYQEGSEGETPALSLEDLQVQESAVEPSEGGNQTGDNREEIASLDSSVLSREDDGDLSQKADQVGDGHVAPPETPATPKKDKKEKRKRDRERRKKKKGQSNEEGELSESVAEPSAPDASSSRPAPSKQRLRRFLEDPYTQNVLYAGQFLDGTPPENVVYLADDVTGRPQHSYVLDEAQPHVGAAVLNWIGQGPNDDRVRDAKPEQRWSRVRDQVTNLGHHHVPRLVSGVTVPISRLPRDTFTRAHMQALYVAYMEAGMRCPVEGCEPWAALEHPRGALPQPQAMLPSGVTRLERSKEDPSRIDLASATVAPSTSFKEHGYQGKGLEGVAEHWQRFHMRRGRCFAAPCCSKTPTQQLAGSCHDLAFASATEAVDHMVDCHADEVMERQERLQEEHKQWEQSGKKGRNPLADLDSKDVRTVALHMVGEMLEVYNAKVGIPRLIGRRRWFSCVNLSRVIVGYLMHANDATATSLGGSQERQNWLARCETDFVSWTSSMPGFSSAPAPKTSGYDTALKKGISSDASKDKAPGPAPKSQPRSGGADRRVMGPPQQAPPPRRPMLSLLAGRVKGGQAAVDSLSASGGEVSSTAATISSAIVRALDASETSTSSLAKSPATTSTADKDKQQHKGKAQDPGKASQKSQGPAGGKTAKTDASSDRGREFTTVGPRKRPRGESKSPHDQPKKYPKGGSGLVASLRKSEGEWQSRAFAAERDVERLEKQLKKLRKEYGELRTSSESDRVRRVASEAAERARADSWKNKAAALVTEVETVKAERDAHAKLLEEADATRASLEDLAAKAETDAKQARTALAELKKEVDPLRKEVQQLRLDSTIVVPSGHLKLYHRVGRHEALWEPHESMEAFGNPPDPVTTKSAWAALHEALKLQQRDFEDTWTSAEQLAKNGEDVDMYPLMYDCARKAVDTISRVTTQVVAPHVAEAGTTARSLEDIVRHLTPRSEAKIEVESHDTISQENERLKHELAEAKKLIEQKSKDVSVMHTYEARNSDCLQSMTKAMRPIAQTLREFVRMTEDEEGVRVQREARELESRVDVLDETLSEVEGKAKPIPLHRCRALPPTPATSTVTKGVATATAAATKVRTPKTVSTVATRGPATTTHAATPTSTATLSLGSLTATAARAASQPIFASRMEVELSRPTTDPDADLNRQIDSVLGTSRAAGGLTGSTGSSQGNVTPPRDGSGNEYVATPQSIRTDRTRSTGKSPASLQKSSRK